MLLKLIILKIRNMCSWCPLTTKRLILPGLEVAMAHWKLPSAEENLLAQSHMPSWGHPAFNEQQMWGEKGLPPCLREKILKSYPGIMAVEFVVTGSQLSSCLCHLGYLVLSLLQVKILRPLLSILFASKSVLESVPQRTSLRRYY